jgi:hypothetical protein
MSQIRSNTYNASLSKAPEAFINNLSKGDRARLYKIGTPDPTSKRSMRRAARGFVSLAVSSRKHRRSINR